MPGSDPEIALSEERGNAALEWVRSSTAQAATARLDALLARSTLADDTYSCSQRLANAAYLHRLNGSLQLSESSALRLRTDAARVAQHPEFRLHNCWFNNHLINNFRSLLLARSTFSALIDLEHTERAIAHLGALLMRHASTLFDDQRGPILAEGSVSYELLILRHLFDIVCSGDRNAFAAAARDWLVTDAVDFVTRFRWKDRWLLPAIGDLSPDWRCVDVVDFLDGTFLGLDTLYRRLWGERLSRLHLPSLCADE